MGDSQRLAEIKQLLSTKEALGIICYNKHHNQKRISVTKLSELLKIPSSKLKETCTKLEEYKLIKTYKFGQDNEIEMVEHDNDDIKPVIDEVIWEQKQEYGRIYKRLITAELLDFMEGDK
jgi:DNA-binding MarR family transcriptional regulator